MKKSITLIILLFIGVAMSSDQSRTARRLGVFDPNGFIVANILRELFKYRHLNEQRISDNHDVNKELPNLNNYFFFDHF